MSSRAITKQPSKATHPSNATQASKGFELSQAIDPSKAFDVAGNNSLMPLNSAPGQFQAILVNVQLTPGQGVNVMPLQQPTTINVSQPNITVNNITYNFASQEPQKHGNHEGSQDRLDQGRQQAAPQSRTIESRPSGVNTSSSKLDTAPKACPKSQDVAVGKSSTSSTSRCAQEQRRQTQNAHKLETDSVRTMRPADGLASPRPLQEVHRKSASSNVTARAQGQVHQPNTRSENKSHGWDLLKPFRSHSDRDNGSRQNANTPAPVTKSPASGRHDSNPTGSRESSTVRRPQNYSNSQPPLHHINAPSGPAMTLTSGRQAAGPPHAETQPQRQHGAVSVPQGHSVVGQGNGGPAAVAEQIRKKQIEAGFERLNSLLGNFKKPEPTRVILIGKASTEMMQLEDREQAYHIDVIVDLPGWEERHSCMEHNHIVQVFREFDKPPKRPNSPHSAAPDQKSFFGRDQQARAAALKRIISVSDRIFGKAHLEVYVMKPPRALRFELSRMAHPDIDEKMRRASGDLVVRLLWQDRKNCAKAGRDRTYQEWRDNLKMEDGSDVPDMKGLINEVERLFKERYGKQVTM